MNELEQLHARVHDAQQVLTKTYEAVARLDLVIDERTATTVPLILGSLDMADAFIVLLAQCEGMTVDGMAVEVLCQVSLHGQTAELRLPYSNTNYACHSQAASSVGRLAANQLASSGQGDRVRFYPVFSTLSGKSPVFMRLPGQPDRETG